MSGTRLAIVLATIAMISAVGWAQQKAVDLPMKDLLVPSGRGLAPSISALGVAGKRVRLEGFMALMEEPPAGGFWLCPTQVFQDESGAGSGDLPPNAVFIAVRGAGKKPIAYLAGRLSVTGIFSIQAKTPRFLLTLDSDKDIASQPTQGKKN